MSRLADLAEPQIREILQLTEQFGHIGFWRLDLKNQTIFWSDAVFDIHGLPVEGGPPALGDAINAYHPDDVPKVQKAVDLAMETGTGFEFRDARIVRPDGTIRRVYSKGECRLDADGHPLEVVGIFQDVTDDFESRKLASEARERLELLTASGAGLWEYNVADNSVLVSRALQRLLGNDRGQPFTLPLEDFLEGIPDAEKSKVWQALFNHVRADIPYLIEHRAKHADGRTIWLRSRGIAERDEIGRALRVVGTVEDITKEKLDENALKEAHSRFDLAVAGASVGIWEIELPNGRMFVSDRLKEITGAPVIASEEADRFVWKPDTFLSNIHPDDQPRMAAAIEAHLTRKEVFEQQYRYRHTGTGEWIDVMVRGQAEWDEAGTPVRMAGSLEDVTDRTRFVSALAASEERFELAVAGATVGIWDWDIVEDKSYWSPLFAELLGYAPGELVPNRETFAGLIHPEDNDATFELLDRHLSEGELFTIEYRLRHKSGAYRWFLGSGKAQINADGTPVRMVGSIQDIHDRKLAEERLRMANLDLERYASVVSHDLQEPLRKISQFSSLLNEEYADKLDGDASLYLDFLIDGATRMGQLIRDMLDYSRLGEFALKVENIPVADCLTDVKLALGSRIEESKAVFKLSGEAEIEADPVLLRQLLQNLLSNAIKFSGGKTPEVEIEVVRDASWDRITVRDQGIGFDMERADRIFEMFGRLHRRDQIAGTGVGLAMCQRIAELHGGRIMCASVPGEGAEFSVSFPRRNMALAA
ncbi:MAG: hypothetical protein CMF74_09605 [Maricaulis sp.]|nr:hypothetical protein [Maricaulis sp.]